MGPVLAETSDALGNATTYEYDANGNRASKTDGTGTTSYARDEQNRLTSVTTPGPVTVGYRYDLDGNRRRLIYPDATAVDYTFDKADRMASLKNSWTLTGSDRCDTGCAR